MAPIPTLSDPVDQRAVLEKNKADREQAEAWFAMLGEVEWSVRFWEELAKLIVIKKLGKVISVTAPPPRTWTEKQVKAFDKEIVPYGAHAGKCVEDVPPSYFEFVQQSTFNMQVIEYMKTPHFKERLAAEQRHG